MLLFVLGCVVRHDLVCCCCVLLMEALFFSSRKQVSAICRSLTPTPVSSCFYGYPRYYEYNQQQF